MGMGVYVPTNDTQHRHVGTHLGVSAGGVSHSYTPAAGGRTEVRPYRENWLFLASSLSSEPQRGDRPQHRV